MAEQEDSFPQLILVYLRSQLYLENILTPLSSNYIFIIKRD